MANERARRPAPGPRPRRRTGVRAILAGLLTVALTTALAPTILAAEPTSARTTDTTGAGITIPGQTVVRSGRERGSTPPVSDPVDDQILIRYRPTTTAHGRAEVTAAQDLEPVYTTPDGQLQVVTARGRSTATIKRELAGDPRVEAVAPNQRRELAIDPRSEPSFRDEWGLDNTGQTVTGSTTVTGVADVDIDGLQALAAGIGDPNVVVAVIDDGVDLGHPDLASRAWTNPGEAGAKATNGIDDDGNGYIDDVHGWDFCNGDNTLHDAGQDGHGTHVAGTIAASLNGVGTVGVAPGVRIMALKFIDDGFTCGNDAQAIEAIDYAASFGVRIINASWGGPEPSSVLDAAIADSGALFVAAAGNSGTNMDAPGSDRFYPASSSLPNIVSVTAIDQSGKLAPFANYGASSVDLAAPGTNILSTYPATSGCPSPCYAWSAGTSMATPHVSGVAALVGSRQPSLLDDPLALRTRLLTTGRTLSALTGKTASGRLVNALRAIDSEAPVVRAPDRFGLGYGSIAGPTSAITYIRWQRATDALSGVASYSLRQHGPEGWSDVATATTATAVTSQLRYGSTYTFRLRATDGVGNVGGPKDTVAITPTLYGDTTYVATYGPGWSKKASASATGGYTHAATKGGASMTFTFTGRAVGVIAPRSASRGEAKIYVDGAYHSTIDLYRSSPLSRAIAFATSWPDRRSHTLRIVVAGTHGHSRVDIDGFIVIR